MDFLANVVFHIGAVILIAGIIAVINIIYSNSKNKFD